MGQMGNYNIPPGYHPVVEPIGSPVPNTVVNLPSGGMISAVGNLPAMRQVMQNSQGKRTVSALEVAKQFGKGLVSPITTIFNSPKSFFMGVGMMAATSALMFATAGAAGPLLLGIGVGFGLFQASKSIDKFINAQNSEELKEACYQAGAAVSTLGLSCLGAKQSLKWTSQLEPEKIGAMSTLNAVSENIKSIPNSILKSFSAFGNRHSYSNLKTGILSTRDLFRPTLTIKCRPEESFAEGIAKLVPEIEKHKVRAVMLDWDNTVMAIGKRQLEPEIVAALKTLQQKKIQIGIVSNNPFPARIQYARNILSKNGLDIPIVWDSVKPCKFGFTRMFKAFKENDPELNDFSQVAMVGDGMINDIVGGNRLNMKTVHAKWFKNGMMAKTKACFLDTIGHIVNPILRLFCSHSKAEYFPAPLSRNA